QHARSAALIQPIVNLPGKAVVILGFGLLVPRLGMLPHPHRPLHLPLIQFALRQRVPEPPGHKDPGLALLPMREMMLRGFDLAVWIEKTSNGGRTFLSALKGARTFL